MRFKSYVPYYKISTLLSVLLIKKLYDDLQQILIYLFDLYPTVIL